ncbi:MAG: secondary thiamine-phosphate synthase enzyme YjbQ [Planctomycetes bacterium]|nr:secondary thiamine-phosphate synthase enzyme YjbQ [Planctomycetota bacterium]
MHAETIAVETPGRGLHEITHRLADAVSRSGIDRGVCLVFLRHTSASLLISENADPTARSDLAAYFDRLAPENDPAYTHTSEGPDDMPSHLRTALTHTSEMIPVTDGRLDLGTWQGLYLFEHRRRPHRRTIAIRVWGE